VNRIFFFSLMISAAVLASCGGKVIVDGLPPSGAGGAGTGGAGSATTTNSSASSNANTTAVGNTGSTGPGQTSTGSGPSCDPTYSCAEAITPSGDPKLLCPGTPSNDLYQALLKCTCGGPCAAACAASACLGQVPTPSCIKCVQDPGVGCGNEFKICANDV
jgi:hypothetical protein